jgi:hypothetical protein
MEPEKKRVRLGGAAEVDETLMEEQAKGDSGSSGTEEPLEMELAEYFKTAKTKPFAPTAQSFLEDPIAYSPESACLQGPIDQEQNTGLIAAVKAGAAK